MNLHNNIQLIAGPCSAESRQQLLSTAEQIKDVGLDYFRAGIWKPRTRPNDFEGVGAKGLDWLVEVREKFGFRVGTEVASTKHVEEAIRAEIDMLWIGTRTTANPFLVEEISQALKGAKIPIMIKNPINPDLKLWIGAFERFKGNNINDLHAIHRGFSVYEKIKYRNLPNWQLAIDFKMQMPQTPLYCDPSHIAGKREYILEISQKALDLRFDGLVIETHCNPEKALTDATQQLTPQQLKEVLGKLVFRRRIDANEEELNEYREQIDIIDCNLVEILGKRMKISEKIGDYKKRNDLTIFQSVRWDELLQKNIDLAQKENLSENFASQLFKLIHQESINIQERILSEKIDEKNKS